MDYLKKYLLIFMALLVLAVVAVAVLAPRKTDAELQDLYVDASSITSSRASDLLDQLKEAEPSTPRPMADDSEFADEADSDIDAAAHAADSLDGASPSEAGAALQAILDPSDTIRARNQFESHLDDMPPGGIRLKVNSVGGALGRVLNDSNYLHIATAEKIGIKPVNSLRDAWEGGRKLERLRSCENYYLDHLTHSLPYLTPRARRRRLSHKNHLRAPHSAPDPPFAPPKRQRCRHFRPPVRHHLRHLIRQIHLRLHSRAAHSGRPQKPSR